LFSASNTPRRRGFQIHAMRLLPHAGNPDTMSQI
jgi:hypothetical protein